jgi:hypothetical protein
MAHRSRPLSAALHKVTEKIYRERGFAAAGVLNNWAAIVGEELARHSMPERLGRDGTLHLRVDGPAATDIAHQEPQIIERIAVYFGYRAVNRLRLVNGPLEKSEAAPRRAPRSLSSESAESLRETVAATQNEEVKGALARLGEALLTRPRDS